MKLLCSPASEQFDSQGIWPPPPSFSLSSPSDPRPPTNLPPLPPLPPQDLANFFSFFFPSHFLWVTVEQYRESITGSLNFICKLLSIATAKPYHWLTILIITGHQKSLRWMSFHLQLHRYSTYRNYDCSSTLMFEICYIQRTQKLQTWCGSLREGKQQLLMVST